MDEINKQLIQHVDNPSNAITKPGGVSFVHRFGASLNVHLHFHCVIIDGLFLVDSKGNLTFQPIDNITETDIQEVQERVRLRVLKYFKRCNLLEDHDIELMKNQDHNGGFSVDGSVCIHQNDREGLERLIRYCARPAFSSEKLEFISETKLSYQLKKPLINGQTKIILTPLELIDKLAALIPPPRVHRHRYFGVFAPNSPFRSAVTAMAGEHLTDEVISPQNPQNKMQEKDKEDKNTGSGKKYPSRYTWAMLLAKIYHLLPLICPECGGEMKIIAVINEKPVINKILGHIGEPTEPPHIYSARSPPDWDELYQNLDPDHLEKQFIPDDEFDQTVSW